LKLLWFACGKDDRLVENARQLSAALKERSIPHEFKETAGNHSWPVWRRYLGEFPAAPLHRDENRRTVRLFDAACLHAGWA
jgi:enterochelin esterase family protein